ncbi:MAG: hypothetical protein Fur0037_06600 [Planctomycetota bacterium]
MPGGHDAIEPEQLLKVLALLLLGSLGVLALAWTDGERPPESWIEPWVDEPAKDAAPASASIAEEGATGSATEPSPPDRVEVPIAPLASPEASGPVVLVTAKKPPMPVAGASVWFIDREIGRRLREKRRLPLGDPDLPSTFGAVFRTDDSGQARLPPLCGPTLVSASSEGRFAFAVLDQRQARAHLHLVDDESLRVLVRAPGGDPAPGVQVAVYQGRSFGRTRRIALGASGADGIARFSHSQLLRRPAREGKAFCAVLPLPLPRPVQARFDGNPAPAEPIALDLPRTGPARVLLVGPGDVPLLHPARIRLELARGKDWKIYAPIDRGFDALSRDKPPGSGPVSFEFVGDGLRLIPTVELGGDRRAWRAEPVATPAARTVRIPLPPEYATLAGRALEDSGRERAAPRLAELTWRQIPFWRGRIAPLADGSFDLPARLKGPLGPVLLTLRAEDRPVGAAAEIARLQPGQRVVLSDLVLSELPPLAAGDVVDDRGTPVPNALVQVQIYGARGPKRDWFDSPLSRTRTDENGAFHLVAERPQGPYRLVAKAPGHEPAHSAEVPRATGVRLVLPRLGTLRGSIRPPRWLPPSALSLALRPLFDPKAPVVRQTIERRDGRFALSNLRTGPYSAEVRLRHLQEPVLRVDGLFVQAGEQRDRRLDGIDLDDLVFRYLLHAVGPDGRGLSGLEGPILARYDGADGKPRQTAFRWRHGRAELIADGPLVNLVLFGPGLLPREVVLGPGEHDVYLQPLFPAVLRLPGLRGLVGPDRRVRVSMISSEKTGYPEALSGVDPRSGARFSFHRWDLGHSGSAWLGAEDLAEVPLSRNGKYQVVLRIYGIGGRQQVSVPLGDVSVILDGPAKVERSLRVDAAKVQKALQELGRKEAAEKTRAKSKRPRGKGARGPGPPGPSKASRKD